jgi:hypothetical protein
MAGDFHKERLKFLLPILKDQKIITAKIKQD